MAVDDSERAHEHQVLSTTTILSWAAGLLVLAGASVVVLWSMLGTGDPRDAVRLDTIRTAGTIVVGTGGAAALLLTARRQRSTELDLKQKDYDATERRITELYGKAADQLGSDKAPVRLAGFYALERLAQGNPAHRQTIVNLICAYLRMPFTMPDSDSRDEELEVRRIAQEILTIHLRQGPAHWADIELNLSGATLFRFTLAHCDLRAAIFSGADFYGATVFRGMTVARNSEFRNANFAGLADFRRVSLGEPDRTFRGARFEGEVDFGTQTSLPLHGAMTRTSTEHRRKWPDGWIERPSIAEPGWADLIEKADLEKI